MSTACAVNEPAYSARRHAAEPGSLRAKLSWLRDHADRRQIDPRLTHWGLRHLALDPVQAERWSARAWWGIAAGELTRVYLYDRQRRDEALSLLRGADWSPVDKAHCSGGVILAAAHIGPPKFLMNAVMVRYDRPMLLTNTRDMPGWLPDVAGPLMDPLTAADRPEIILRSALHLRSGGILFGAPDGGYSAKHTVINEFGRAWRFSFGLAALAQLLGVRSFCAFALWEGNDIALRTVPIELPDQGPGDEEWRHAWIAEYWAALAPIIASSPENLRFLSGPFRQELGR